MNSHPTNGIIIRPPVMSDAPAVTELINISSLSDMGQPTVTTAELQDQWQEVGFDLETDAWVVVSAEGKAVGYEELFNRHGHFDLQGDGYVNKFFDPGLIFIAFDEDEIAAAAIGRIRFEHGWISTLGVRRPWRRQGLGRALLLAAFNEFYRRGEKIVALSVDAENPTGATHLYDRAGMCVYQKFVLYEKELHPGRPFFED